MIVVFEEFPVQGVASYVECVFVCSLRLRACIDLDVDVGFMPQWACQIVKLFVA